MTKADVAVVGLGPSGRALAHRLLAHGVRVLAVDPRPEGPWPATYGGWEDQLPDWLDDGVVGARSEHTVLRAEAEYRLSGTYAVLDNDRLQAALSLDGAEVRTARVSDDELRDLAEIVVDCRGARRGLRVATRPLQTAHGVRLERAQAQPLLGGADAALMDWRPYDGRARWGAEHPSFLYVIPLPDGRVLAEETCLVGAPALDASTLESRLRTRLARHGVGADALEAAEVEKVRIPMLPPPPGPVPAFGAAGAELNPITGYSVFASLARADRAAVRVATTGRLDQPRHPVRRRALAALLELAPDEVYRLFDSFGRLDAAGQRSVFNPHAPTPAVLRALTAMWVGLPARGRAGLVGATARGLRR